MPKASENASGADNQQERLLMSSDYVVGLIDGEGYFSVTARIDRSKSYQSFRVQFAFGVKLKEEDGDILFDLKQFFGCGEVRKRIDTRPTFSNCLEYQVRDSRMIREVIIPFFEEHSLRFHSKRKSFKRFSEIIILFSQGVHLQLEGFRRVEALAKELHQ